MKLLVFTDTHNSRKALKNVAALCRKQEPDAIVCCGDISIFEMNLGKTIRFLAGLKKPLIIVNGNHEGERSMAKLCRRVPNAHFVHDSNEIIGDVLFLGYGGDGFSVIDPAFVKVSKSLERIIKANRGKKVVLVTHAPPYGTRLDKVFGSHSGNKSIRKFVERWQPAYHFCGHIHENSGKQDRIGKTIVVNAGPFGKMVKV
ncbi:TPA: hypothetical protein HA281_01475 [Candidatus Woesearchaeota archaeon]|nr:hypothetical protein [Candidatus Woesearchaeota archaeon]HIH91449.1 hypothetical protein [Candidatus Woesearchaeota archaeon]HII64475.1 hypothetical protein [Candidatus Woesearchaeota archaeon]HIJ18060.1 hypothetical protein [Candidatus Woesearchaeota archaeon]